MKNNDKVSILKMSPSDILNLKLKLAFYMTVPKIKVIAPTKVNLDINITLQLFSLKKF